MRSVLKPDAPRVSLNELRELPTEVLFLKISSLDTPSPVLVCHMARTKPMQ